MKIKINTPISLKSGVEVPAGSVVKIEEIYVRPGERQNGSFPAQVATRVYSSELALESGKPPLQDVNEFDPLFNNLKMSESDFAEKTGKEAALGLVFIFLSRLFPDKVEVL